MLVLLPMDGVDGILLLELLHVLHDVDEHVLQLLLLALLLLLLLLLKLVLLLELELESLDTNSLVSGSLLVFFLGVFLVFAMIKCDKCDENVFKCVDLCYHCDICVIGCGVIWSVLRLFLNVLLCGIWNVVTWLYAWLLGYGWLVHC